MFKIYDVVFSGRDLLKVPKGSIGTILVVHDTGVDYLVEFINLETSETLDILTVNEKDLKISDK